MVYYNYNSQLTHTFLHASTIVTVLQTAYFTIGPTMAHGTELICSYPSCRADGSKFRYCFYCNEAVHKRNFMKEHSHNQDHRNLTESSPTENIKIGSQRANNFGAVDDVPVQRSDGHHAEARFRNVEGMIISAKASHSHDIGNNLLLEGAAPGERQGLQHIIDSENKPGIEEGLLSRWVTLFMERPMVEDQNSMTIWLKRVLSVSENVKRNDLQSRGVNDSMGRAMGSNE